MRFICPFHLRWFTLAFIVVISISCGGGGSGGSGGISGAAFSYNGTTEQAVITEDNAEKLVMGSYSGGEIGSVTASDGTSRTAAYGGSVDTGYDYNVFNLIRSNAKDIYFDPIAKSAVPRTARPMNNVVYGNCGGSLSISLTINESSGNFSGSFEYSEYCDHNVVINGSGKMSGLYDFSQDKPIQIRMSFASMTISMGTAITTFNRIHGLMFPRTRIIRRLLITENCILHSEHPQPTVRNTASLSSKPRFTTRKIIMLTAVLGLVMSERAPLRSCLPAAIELL